MTMIERHEYRAQIKEEYTTDDISKNIADCIVLANNLITSGKILTANLYYYKNMLFLYYEEVISKDCVKCEKSESEIHNLFLKPIENMLCDWPQYGRITKWAKMNKIFYHSIPRSVEEWMSDRKPDKKQGRIALLDEEKMFGYVYHHKALVDEGLIRGDKYQYISLHENLLFSYFEEPRSSVNILEDYSRESEAINAWMQADPESHFIHFKEANGENFLILPNLFTL